MITWNRWKITKDTIRSFEKHNGKKDFIIVDNGSSDKTVRFLDKNGYEVLRNEKNEGIFMATRRGWLESYNRGYDFIINLQNDFPCVKTVPYEDLELYMGKNPDVGFVRLNDKSRLLYPKARGGYTIKRRKRHRNYITKKRLWYKQWRQYGNSKFRKCNYHFSFNPNFFRAKLVPRLVGKVVKRRELQVMERFHKTKLLSAQLKGICFETIIRPREKRWIH